MKPSTFSAQKKVKRASIAKSPIRVEFQRKTPINPTDVQIAYRPQNMPHCKLTTPSPAKAKKVHKTKR
jgi:hypothetical protein